MKLQGFVLSRFPYWERGPLRFSDELFGEGIHLISGPNGVGKSTVCKALRALLWPETLPKAMPLSLWSRWKSEGKEFVLQRDEWETRCSSKEGELELAKLPDARFADCYFSSIEELLSAQDQNLASLIAREITGGYDLQKIENTPLFSPPRFHGRTEWKELIETEKELREALRKGAQWKKEEQLLLDKKKELEVVAEKERKRGQIGRALEYRRLLKRKKGIEERRARFPKALEAMSGREETLFFSLEEREKSLVKRFEELSLEAALLEVAPVVSEEDLLVLEALTRKIEEGEKRREECLRTILRLKKELAQSERLLCLTREQLTAHAEGNLLLSQKKWSLWKEYKTELAALEARKKELSQSGEDPEKGEALVLLHLREKSLFFSLVWEGGLLISAASLAYFVARSYLIGCYVLCRFGYLCYLWKKQRDVRKKLRGKEPFSRAKELWGEALRGALDQVSLEGCLEREGEVTRALEQLEAEESSLLAIGEILSSELGPHLLQWERSYAALLVAEEEEKKVGESLEVLYGEFQSKAPRKVPKELSSVQVCFSFLRKAHEEVLSCRDKEKRLSIERFEIEKKKALLDEEKRAFFAPFGGERTLFFSCLEQRKEFLQVEKEREEVEEKLSAIPEEGLYPYSTWAEEELVHLLEQMDSLAEKKEQLLIEIVRKERDIDEGKRGVAEAEKEEKIALAREKLHSRFRELLIAKAGRLLIDEAQKRLVDETEPEVYQIASRFFAEFTRGAYRFLCPRLGGRDYICEETATLRRQTVQELSTATKMQLLLSVRLAFTEVNEANAFSLPLFWDETLTTSDPTRLRAMVETLVKVGKKRQLFYFTSSPEEEAIWRESAEKEGVPFHAIAIDADQGPSLPLSSLLDKEEIKSELAGKGVLYWHQLETLFQAGAAQPLLPEEITQIQRQLIEAPKSASSKKKSSSELILLFTSLSVAPRYFSPLVELYEEVQGHPKEWLSAIKQKKHPALKGFRKEVLERLSEVLDPIL